jgi:hypothetical protein
MPTCSVPGPQNCWHQTLLDCFLEACCFFGSLPACDCWSGLPSEPPLVEEGGGAPPAGWPRTGALRYEGVTASYRPGLPPVLRDLTFSLQVGQWAWEPYHPRRCSAVAMQAMPTSLLNNSAFHCAAKP